MYTTWYKAGKNAVLDPMCLLVAGIDAN